VTQGLSYLATKLQVTCLYYTNRRPTYSQPKTLVSNFDAICPFLSGDLMTTSFSSKPHQPGTENLLTEQFKLRVRVRVIRQHNLRLEGHTVQRLMPPLWHSKHVHTVFTVVSDIIKYHINTTTTQAAASLRPRLYTRDDTQHGRRSHNPAA